ncbi:MAG: SAV_6107 family HEPN domain-containing protein [Candidatus Nanopelagicales bacterium]
MAVQTIAAPVPYQARDLLSLAARSLLEAYTTPDPGVRFVTAHLAALRAAAAVLATRAHPGQRGRIRSVWVLLPTVAPQLQEWASFYAASAGKRAAVDAGFNVVTQREADDLVRDSETFLMQVAAVIGVDHQSVLP